MKSSANRYHRALALAVAVLLSVAGLFVGHWGFGKIKSVWELERIPAAPIDALLPGEVLVSGVIDQQDTLLTSRLTQQPAIYFRYLHEVEEGSGDDRRWRTVEDIQQAADFSISSGQKSLPVSVEATVDAIDWSLQVSASRSKGNHRYTEWLLRPNDSVSIFGWYALQAGEPVISFSEPGHYLPIVTTYGPGYEIQALGQGGVFILWAGMLLLGLAIYAVCYGLAIHRTLAFLTLLSMTMIALLLGLGLHTYKVDLSELVARWDRQVAAVDKEIGVIAKRNNQEWGGLTGSNSFVLLGDLAEADNRRISGLKSSLERAYLTNVYQMSLIPNRWLAPAWGIALTTPAAIQSGNLDALAGDIAESRPVAPLWIWIAMAIACLGSVLLTWFGLRAVKTKRWMENIPTSKIAGVAWGLNELNGVVEKYAGQSIRGPLSNADCCWFDYRVYERIKQGNKTSWKRIERRCESQQFLLRDDSGQALADPKDAEVISSHKKTRRQGNLRYTETSIRFGDPLYLLGVTRHSTAEAYPYVLGKGDSGEPCILSNRSEYEVLLRKSRLGLLLLNFAASALLLASLLLLTSTGVFSGLDFLTTALISTGYLFLLMLIMHYNDLVFLKHRAERCLANIDVAFQKRHDLLQNLIPVVKRFAAHEQELLGSLTRMRKQKGNSPAALPDRIKRLTSQSLIAGQFFGLREQYPELKQDQAALQLMENLTRLEDEIALMREGYNSAVETYLTRLGSFPDLIFARLFGFRSKDFVALAG